MEKQKILNDYKKQEDKILLAQVLDKIEFSKQREKIEYTDFLDMYQIALVKTFLKKIEFENYVLFGGFENAERNILLIYPEKYNMVMVEKNYSKIIKAIKNLWGGMWDSNPRSPVPQTGALTNYANPTMWRGKRDSNP